jgi:hypothetical protein
MAINYTWDVSTVDTYPTKDGNADVVNNVHWRLKATDDTNKDSSGNNWSAELYGTQVLNTDSISNFVAFGSLNSSKVQSWVEAAMGDDEVTRWKGILDRKIADDIARTISVIKQIG